MVQLFNYNTVEVEESASPILCPTRTSIPKAVVTAPKEIFQMTVKKTRIALGLALALTLCGSAVLAKTCASAPMSVYKAPGFSCTIGNLLFENFKYTPTSQGGGFAPPAQGVQVTPVIKGVNSGFQFSGGFIASSGQTVGGIIQYTVKSQGPSLSSWLLSMVAGAVGTGSARAMESKGSGKSLSTFVAGKTHVLSDEAALSAGQATVTLTLGVNGGTSGVASLLSVDTLWSSSAE
jgi:hypothetical protein